tara:strand:- start:834 stop:1457 length:624 start_codon:yes stop_codon:yes gene_type:complete
MEGYNLEEHINRMKLKQLMKTVQESETPLGPMNQEIRKADEVSIAVSGSYQDADGNVRPRGYGDTFKDRTPSPSPSKGGRFITNQPGSRIGLDMQRFREQFGTKLNNENSAYRKEFPRSPQRPFRMPGPGGPSVIAGLIAAKPEIEELLANILGLNEQEVWHNPEGSSYEINPEGSSYEEESYDPSMDPKVALKDLLDDGRIGNLLE